MHGTYPDHILRFLRREGCRWAPHAHAIPQVEGRVESIPASRHDLAFIHVPRENMSVLLAKADAYTESERIRRRERGEKATLGKLMGETRVRILQTLHSQKADSATARRDSSARPTTASINSSR